MQSHSNSSTKLWFNVDRCMAELKHGAVVQ